MKQEILKNTRCLVIGSMENDRLGGYVLREEIENSLNKFDISVLNHYKCPIISDISEGDNLLFDKLKNYKLTSDYESIVKYKQIRYNDLALVDKCDFVICCLDMKSLSCGTWEELFRAVWCNKPIFLYCTQGKENIPIWVWWTLNVSDIYNDLTEILDKVEKIHYGIDDSQMNDWKLLNNNIR